MSAQHKADRFLELRGPLTFLAFSESIRPGSTFGPADTGHVAYDLEGDLDLEALALALTDLGNCQQILWTRLFKNEDGLPRLAVETPGAIPLTIYCDDSAGSNTTPLPDHILLVDASEAPLIRAIVHRRTNRLHRLILVVHHLAADAWSIGLYARTLAGLYARRKGLEPEAPIFDARDGYFDLVEEARLSDRNLNRASTFWREYLSNIPMMKYPTDSKRNDALDHRVGNVSQDMDESMHSLVRDSSRRYKVTPFMLLLAALVLVVSKATGELDVVIPTLWSGREDKTIRHIGGPTVNALIIRIRIQIESTIGEYVDAVRTSVLKTYWHAWTPIDKVAEQTPRVADFLSDPEYIRLLFKFLPHLSEPMAFPGLITTRVQNPDEITDSRVNEDPLAQDLLFSILENQERLCVDVSFNENLFTPATIRGLASDYEESLKGLCESSQTLVGSLLGREKRG